MMSNHISATCFQIYMLSEWYKPGCCLEYPLGGSGAVIDALVQGLKKFNGRLSLKSHVESIIVEDGRAIGVKLRGGQVSKRLKTVMTCILTNSFSNVRFDVIQ